MATIDKHACNRNLILGDYVQQSTVKDLIQKICDINSDDSAKEKEFKGYEREPIKLFINSYGGSIYDGLALIGAIEMSDTPICTICLGSAMSMGLIIFLSGDKRYIHRFATVLYHEASTFVWDKIEAVKQSLKETERIQEVIDNYVLEKTNILSDKLYEVKSKKLDWYISANEAVKLGIADDII